MNKILSRGQSTNVNYVKSAERCGVNSIRSHYLKYILSNISDGSFFTVSSLRLRPASTRKKTNSLL